MQWQPVYYMHIVLRVFHHHFEFFTYQYHVSVRKVEEPEEVPLSCAARMKSTALSRSQLSLIFFWGR